jgi:uncharacterized protein
MRTTNFTTIASNLLRLLLTGVIQLWRYGCVPVLMLFGAGRCRFTPSCSSYGLEAIQRHGPVHGAVLTAQRICRCHPWGDGGHDPVPQNISSHSPSHSIPQKLVQHD